MRKRILKQCLQLAREKNNPISHPEYNNFHHFSFIIQNNKILGMGMNRFGKPLAGLGYPEFGKIHSENDVYRKVKGILDRQKYFEIVNIRLNKDGDLRLSKPCQCCFNFLKIVECKSVYFSTDVGFAKIAIS